MDDGRPSLNTGMGGNIFYGEIGGSTVVIPESARGSAMPSTISSMMNAPRVGDTSFPTATAPPSFGSSSFPTTNIDVFGPNETTAGISDHNKCVTAPYVIRATEGREAELIPSRMSFVGRYDLRSAAINMLTLQQINARLRKFYKVAVKLLREGMANGIKDGPSAEEMKQLYELPTTMWKQLKFFREGTVNNGVLFTLNYLNVDWVVDTFNCHGHVLNNIADVERKSVTLGVYGYVEKEENVYGSHLQPEMDLYMTLSLYTNSMGESYLQFIPHASFEIPSPSHYTFTDITGHRIQGYCMRTGKCLRPVQGLPFKECNKEEDAGLVDPSSSYRSFLRPSLSALISTRMFRKGLRTYYML